MASLLLQPVEGFGKLAVEPEIARPLPEAGPDDAGADVPALDAAGFVFAGNFEIHQVLRDDHIAFGSHHFGDVGDAPAAVAQAFGLDDDIDRTHDHFADGLHRQLIAAHRDHGFKA